MFGKGIMKRVPDVNSSMFTLQCSKGDKVHTWANENCPACELDMIDVKRKRVAAFIMMLIIFVVLADMIGPFDSPMEIIPVFLLGGVCSFLAVPLVVRIKKIKGK